ncbi:SMI1/KNR4 family protein [Nocardia sp. NPDC059240]|uniref:SMI1/KNR4 family protein n=1 Tax=Nocardia sp. NPDC059240 TaxID=3346786 RepID=UPI0036BB1781
MTDWQRRMADLYRLQQRADEINGFDPPPAPASSGASAEAFAAAEQRLGVRFDDSYREVMTVVNGWPQFAGMWEIFAVDDLGTENGPWAHANYLADTCIDNTDEPDEFLPPPSGTTRILLASARNMPMHLVAMISQTQAQAASLCIRFDSGGDYEFPDFQAWLDHTEKAGREFIADTLDLR